MLKGLILLADGFETIEALTVKDVLTRTHSLTIDLVSIGKSKEVRSSHNVHVLSDKTLDEIDYRSYDFLVLPGGKTGVDNLKQSARVAEIIRHFKAENKWICAICAAPSILGEMGYLDGYKYTCFPGFERGNGDWINTPSVVDQHLITGRAMGASLPFALAIVRALLGEISVCGILPGIDGRE